MLEKLPDVIGHALRGQRAGADQTAFRLIDLRQGMGSIGLRSPDFIDHGPLPVSCTADGEGISPALAWTGVPEGAASLVLIVEDADAPTPHPLVHAIVVDIEPTAQSLDGGALDDAQDIGLAGRNSYLRTGWLPPDPPPGHGVHRYAFQLFALAPGAAFDGTPGRDAVLQALTDHAMASGCLTGTYERPDGSIKSGAAETADTVSAVPVLPVVPPLAGA